MKVRIHIIEQDWSVRETISAGSAEEVVSRIKSRVQQELPFALRLLIGAMGPLSFAQEVVRNYNKSRRKNLPPPGSCSQFLEMAQREGFAVIEEP